MPRVAKGDKGQFFTPRHVVDFVVKALAPRAREVVVDPACGSGAFLAHARAFAAVKTFGSDVDPRAIRVARLVALSQGRDPATIVRGDGLGGAKLPTANVVATNPPFAGRADATGFEVARVVRTPERDVLFLERALDLLRPGGRMGIVLPVQQGGGRIVRGDAALARGARAHLCRGGAAARDVPPAHVAAHVRALREAAASGGAARPSRARDVRDQRAGREGRRRAPASRARDGGVGLDHDLDDVLAVLVPFLTAEGFAS